MVSEKTSVSSQLLEKLEDFCKVWGIIYRYDVNGDIIEYDTK